MKEHVRNLAACCGLSSLLFFALWGQLQSAYSPLADYFRAAPPNPALFIATLTDTLVLAFGFWGASIAVRRSGNRILARMGRCLFLLVLGGTMPGTALRMSVPSLPWIWISLLNAAWLGACILAATLTLALDNRWFFATGRSFTTLLAALLPVFAISAGLDHWRASSKDYSARYSSPVRSGSTNDKVKAPVLILVFDELDERLAFSDRPNDISMPSFDRLRNESLWADNALPPAECTALSLPRLITGVTDLRRTANEATIPVGNFRLPAHWGKLPNLFKAAKEAGLRTALVGYYHPYCGVLDGSLDYCWSVPPPDATDSMRAENYCAAAGAINCTGHQMRRMLDHMLRRFGRRDDLPARNEHVVLRKDHLQQSREARSRLLSLITDGSYDLVFAHLPVPHPFGVYDRHTNKYSLDERANYFDNLELADRILGDVRAAMEASYVWNTATVIVTSDHGFRPYIWSQRPTWTAEEEMASRGGETLRVPLMIKLPAPTRPSRFEQPVNALIVGKLVAARMSTNAINNSDQLRSWMEQNRNQTWVSDLARCF